MKITAGISCGDFFFFLCVRGYVRIIHELSQNGHPPSITGLPCFCAVFRPLNVAQ